MQIVRAGQETTQWRIECTDQLDEQSFARFVVLSNFDTFDVFGGGSSSSRFKWGKMGECLLLRISLSGPSPCPVPGVVGGCTLGTWKMDGRSGGGAKCSSATLGTPDLGLLG